MNQKSLYAILLWWRIQENLIEDHNIVFVIANNEQEARKLAKEKWNANEMHIDWTQKIEMVDWYKIILEKQSKTWDNFELNTDYID